MKQAFTLIEILLTIAIVAVFATMALVVIDPVKINKNTQDVAVTDAMKDIASAFELFKLAQGRYPNATDLAAGGGANNYINQNVYTTGTGTVGSDDFFWFTSDAFHTSYIWQDGEIRYFYDLECMVGRKNIDETTYLIWMPDCQPNIFTHTGSCVDIDADPNFHSGTATYCQ